jgi:hypothetical protein
MIINYLTESTSSSSTFTQKDKEFIRQNLYYDISQIISKDAANKDPYVQALKNRFLYWINAYTQNHITFDKIDFWATYLQEDNMLIKDSTLDLLNFDQISINFTIGTDQYKRNRVDIDTVAAAFHNYTRQEYGEYQVKTDVATIKWNSNEHTFGSWISIDYETFDNVSKVIASIPWTSINQELAERANIDITRKELGPIVTEAFLKSSVSEKIYKELSPIIDDFFMNILDE